MLFVTLFEWTELLLIMLSGWGWIRCLVCLHLEEISYGQILAIVNLDWLGVVPEMEHGIMSRIYMETDFGLTLRTLLIIRVIPQLNKLSKEVASSLSLEVFRERGCVNSDALLGIQALGERIELEKIQSWLTEILYLALNGCGRRACQFQTL